jgi:type I restriction enzyme S subunit
MNVPKGYKMTEVGVIPEDWEVKKLGDIADSQKDWSFTGGPFGSDLKSSDYTQDGVRVIQLQNIGDGEFKNDYEIYTSYKKANELLSCNIYPNDIIISKMGDPVARACIVPSYHDRYLMCSDGIRLAVDQKRFNTYFICKYINFPPFRAQAENASTGTTRKRISLAELKNLTILCPKISEQRSIARVLSDTDALINALDKLIAKKRDIKKAVMQELLTGKTRLPGFSGKWDYKKIGEFTDCVAGGTPNTTVESYWGGNIRWMSSGELHQRFVYDVEGRITEEGLKNSNTKIIPANCVLVGLAGQGKTRGTVALNKVPLCTNQSIAAIYPNDLFSSEYLFYNLDDRYEELRSLSTGSSGRGGLNLTIIRDVLVLFPEKNEQQAIAQVLSDMDREITALEQRRDKTKALKQGMMQALLTGRIRLH